MMEIRPTDEWMFARHTDTGEQLIVIGIASNDNWSKPFYLVVYNEKEKQPEKYGMSQILSGDLVRFEHFFWPDVSPSRLKDEENRQDPAGMEW